MTYQKKIGSGAIRDAMSAIAVIFNDTVISTVETAVVAVSIHKEAVLSSRTAHQATISGHQTLPPFLEDTCS